MKKIISTSLIVLLISSCSFWGEDSGVSTEKQDFFVETKLWSSFQNESILEKTGRVSSSQDIQLTSNANGRIRWLQVKVGDSVSAGQTLVRLEDTLWNYGIAIQRAQNSVERAQINYDSQVLGLDKQIFDAEVTLSNLNRNLEVALKSAEQNILQAQNSVQTSSFTSQNTPSQLQIDQLDNTISRLELEYQTKLISDQETVEWFKSNLKKEIISLTFTLDDIIEFSDNILSVTQKNFNSNDNFDQFLWVKDTDQRKQSEALLLELIRYRNSGTYDKYQEQLNTGNISEAQISEIIDYLNTWYNSTKNLLNNLETTLNNSTPSVGLLDQSKIDGFLAQINAYQSALQGSYTWFISLSNSIKSFLRTYENNQESILKNIELQKRDKDIQIKNQQIQLNNLQSSELNATIWLEQTQINTTDSIANIRSQISSAKNTMSNLDKNYDVTKRSLQNAITEAKIWLSSAQKDYAKLTISSPINGTVGEVFVDLGQEVNTWTPIANLLSDNTPEVQVAFSSTEVWFIEVWQEVKVVIGTQSIVGTIYSLSDVADKNLNYVSTIVFESGVNIIGDIVQVLIPIKTEKTLYPLNIITVWWNNVGSVNIFTPQWLDEAELELWEIYGDYAEIISCTYKNEACSNQKIIVSDVSNYENEKFNLVEQNNEWKK